MSGDRSFRSRLWLGSILWTLGVLLVTAVLLVVFLATHPRPHLVMLGWFVTVPAAVIVMAGLLSMVAGALQIRRGLSAVDRLRGHLAAVQHGRTARLTGRYPTEVQPLVDDLNALLEDRQSRIAQAAAAAGDLAHGLKTPLAVLACDAERAALLGEKAMAASMNAQIDRMRRQVDYHLAGVRAAATARTPGTLCRVAPALDGIVRALERIYAERNIRFAGDIAPGHAARCAREDLEEMLGNLLDNAGKWARGQVRITSTLTATAGKTPEGEETLTGAASDKRWLTIAVEDDGPGLDEAMVESVLARGVRGDQRQPGSGLGLAIVRHIADLYGGRIVLDRSPLGGLRAQLTLEGTAGDDRSLTTED